MKKILKNWFINSVSLGVIGWLFSGIEVSSNPPDFFIATLLLTIIIKLIKPVFELVFLPINLITLGVFRWVRTIISLGIVVYLAKGVSLNNFYFPGVSLGATNIQSFGAPAFASLIAGAILLTILKKLIRWILKSS